MSESHTDDLNIGGRLYEAGCKQGAMFRADDAETAYNEIDEGEDRATLHRSQLAGESLVVISQDCDVLSNREPEIEALICRVEPDRSLINSYERNSARFFVVSPQGNLVACAWDRVRLRKTLAARYDYLKWPSDATRFQRFTRWLGRRYNRPALPDELVEHFDRPLQKVLGGLQKRKPETVRHFSEAFYEMRLALPSRGERPFDVSVLLMARGDELSEEQLGAVQEVETAVRVAIDSDCILLEDFAPVLESELSVAEYFRTVPLYSDNFTYRGDETAGQEPYQEAS